jgi:V8-like Glu-specific endopeptidase
MKRIHLLPILGLALLGLALLLSTDPVLADDPAPQSEAQTGEAITIEAARTDIRQTERYWTRARMQRASSLDLIGVSPEELAAAIAASGPEVEGKPGFIAGTLPEGVGLDVDNAALAWTSDLAPTVGAALPFSGYTGNYYASRWKVYPWNTIGLLTFKIGSTSYRCSASAIGPNTIVTAAHCVYDTAANRWYNTFSFCPAYRDGVCPYGQFAWRRVLIPPGYANASSFNYGIRYDVALIELGTNSAGKGVHQMVGTMGLSWNQSYNQTIRTVGYPVKYNSGKYSYVCDSTTIAVGTDIMEMGCNTGGGHSGGPWVRGFGSSNLVNNAHSYGYISGPLVNKHAGAARFSSSNIVILCGSSPGC